ncbi:hypothetical protein Scep_004357 [Stephania cephalantha]|uniref:Uncharacterized protein n=1 Tax=Stephania cephalantha TaxID=152367 RepID=A0AAP0KSB5_9MAGN
MKLPRSLLGSTPFCQLLQQHLKREDEARPILLYSPLILNLSGPSKNTSGSQSFRTFREIFALDKDEDDDVTPNDVFLHVHTKDHDGVTFIDSRSLQLHAELVRSHSEARAVRGFRAEPVVNAHGLWREHLSGTIAAAATTTTRASPTG